MTGTKASETLTGTNGEDKISGLGGRDVLVGLGGADLLDGGRGVDRMSGGAGDDTYVVDTLGDRVIEAAGAGTDTVLSTARSVVLRANVENLTFTNGGPHLGYGNRLANVMTGGTGSDRLFGRGGDDTLNGGGGEDYLSGGMGDDALWGGNGNDLLFGAAGNDTLDGGLGGDRMFGGKGNDSYVVDNLADRVFESAGGGIDEVRSTVDFRLNGATDHLTLVGDSSANGTGNLLDNRLTGNIEANILSGKGGRDTIDGGRGNDRLTGGDGADFFVFSTAPSTASNSDLITDFSRAEGDRIWLSIAVFSDFDVSGSISADAFLAAPGAIRAREDGQFLIYNTDTGSLYYDAEGLEGRGPIEIAQLGLREHPVLTFSAFLLVD